MTRRGVDGNHCSKQRAEVAKINVQIGLRKAKQRGDLPHLLIQALECYPHTLYLLVGESRIIDAPYCLMFYDATQ